MKFGSFGELLLRITAEKGKTFSSLPDRADLSYGGSEFNFLANIANMGAETNFITALPDNTLGRSAQRYIRLFNVNGSFIEFSDQGRLGLYFLEEGCSIRGSKVTYDREGAAINTLTYPDYRFDSFFRSIDHYHISGITPALSENSMRTVQTSLANAKKAGLTISCDLNYRANLWKYYLDGIKVNPSIVMHSLLMQVDHLTGNESDLQNFFGITPGDKLYLKPEFDISYYQNILLRASGMFPHIKSIAITLRTADSTDTNNLGAICFIRETNSFFITPFTGEKYNLKKITGIRDRVGTGDAFASGYIYGLYKYNFNYQKALDFGFASFVMKHSFPGDQSYSDLVSIEKYIDGSHTSLINR